MDITMLGDLAVLVNMTKEDLPYIGIAIVVLLFLSYLIPRAVFFLYSMNTPDAVQQILRSIIYKLDEYADELSNAEKRMNAINKIHGLLLYRGIILPKFVCGWIVDFQVQYIRNLQEANYHLN